MKTNIVSDLIIQICAGSWCKSPCSRACSACVILNPSPSGDDSNQCLTLYLRVIKYQICIPFPHCIKNPSPLQGLTHRLNRLLRASLSFCCTFPTHASRVVFSVTLFAPTAPLAIPQASYLSPFIANPNPKQKASPRIHFN